MKKTMKTRLFAIVLCLAMILSFMPTLVFAEQGDPALPPLSPSYELEEGEVRTIVPAGTVCTSTDPSVAWVDEAGNLNALKSGTTILTVASDGGENTECTVTVNDFKDGSETVGRLKILARFNDSMSFYDGHVYLLFTSYQDGVDIAVNDLYGAYEISDQYYKDIREDISKGSNHTNVTRDEADRYFTLHKDLSKMTLNRGEIVTIGMYRDFDLSVQDAALGMIQNSPVLDDLIRTGKKTFLENLISFMDQGPVSIEEATKKIEEVIALTGEHPEVWLNGVVDGGVCFNRELYNQKLEWDQYENVTYELDITRNQLDALMSSLNGNLNQFNVMKNSCATVALRAWNASVGTRPDGTDSAYKLSAQGEGIFAYMDAPAGVKQNIMKRLPGYYLNNSEMVQEPDASFVDDTGYVYVSAPEKVAPVDYACEDASLQIDADRTKLPDLVRTAIDKAVVSYGIDSQKIDVRINTEVEGDAKTIDLIEFTINGNKYYINATKELPDGIWFRTQANPQAGAACYVTDKDGNALPSEYADGWVSFHVNALPASFQVVGTEPVAKNVLKTTITNEDKIGGTTKIYTKAGGVETVLGETAQVAAGTKVFIKPGITMDPANRYLLYALSLNGVSILDQDHFDPEEEAFCLLMPDKYSVLSLDYESAVILNKLYRSVDQVFVGDTLKVTDYADLLVGGKQAPEALTWGESFELDDSMFEWKDYQTIEVKKAGIGVLVASPRGNDSLHILYIVEACESREGMVKVTCDDVDMELFSLFSENGQPIPFSGYCVPKGTKLTFGDRTPYLDGKVISSFTCNGKQVAPGGEIVADEDVDIKVEFREAEIKGIPDIVKFNAKGDSCQLKGKVQYKGLFGGLTPVYDPSIAYLSSDPDLVDVDENGKITVVGDVPAEGAIAYISATAGSSEGTVSTMCKVVLGEPAESRIVGRLTVSDRPVVKAQLIGHSVLTFTSYEDLDLNVSYHDYYQPNEKYYRLMEDYEEHPEKYVRDPALYIEDLPLAAGETRESFFNVYEYGPGSEARPVSMKSGESITISNYGFDTNNYVTFLKAIRDGSMASSENVQKLVHEMELYREGKEYDVDAGFEGLVKTFMEMYVHASMFGVNPADGHSNGGIAIGREGYNQFRRDDSQMPNNYYTIEITEDELAHLKLYLADPANNYYSLFTKNCTAGVVDAWNTTLYDRPSLHLTGGYTVFAPEPESMYFQIGAMKDKNLGGEGGKDFYPRATASHHEMGVTGEGNKLTVKCVRDYDSHLITDPCEYKEGCSVTIKADACEYSHVALEGVEAFNAMAGTEVTVDENYVKFCRITTDGITDVPEGTDTPGLYYAELRVNGASAYALFTILPEKVVPEVTLEKDSYVYNGKVQHPQPVVMVKGKVLDPSAYTVTYSEGCKAVGNYKLTVTLNEGGRYSGSNTASFKITKAANKVTKVTTSKSLKAATLQKKAQSFTISAKVKESAKKAFKVSKWNTAAAKKYIKVTKAGKVTVKKGTPKGTYKFTVKITTAATKNYLKTTVAKMIKVVVK